MSGRDGRVQLHPTLLRDILSPFDPNMMACASLEGSARPHHAAVISIGDPYQHSEYTSARVCSESHRLHCLHAFAPPGLLAATSMALSTAYKASGSGIRESYVREVGVEDDLEEQGEEDAIPTPHSPSSVSDLLLGRQPGRERETGEGADDRFHASHPNTTPSGMSSAGIPCLARPQEKRVPVPPILPHAPPRTFASLCQGVVSSLRNPVFGHAPGTTPVAHLSSNPIRSLSESMGNFEVPFHEFEAQMTHGTLSSSSVSSSPSPSSPPPPRQVHLTSSGIVHLSQGDGPWPRPLAQGPPTFAPLSAHSGSSSTTGTLRSAGRGALPRHAYHSTATIHRTRGSDLAQGIGLGIVLGGDRNGNGMDAAARCACAAVSGGGMGNGLIGPGAMGSWHSPCHGGELTLPPLGREDAWEWMDIGIPLPSQDETLSL